MAHSQTDGGVHVAPVDRDVDQQELEDTGSQQEEATPRVSNVGTVGVSRRVRKMTERARDFQLQSKRKRRDRAHRQVEDKSQQIRSRLVENVPTSEIRLLHSHWLTLYETFLDQQEEWMSLVEEATPDDLDKERVWADEVMDLLSMFRTEVERWILENGSTGSIRQEPDVDEDRISKSSRSSRASSTASNLKIKEKRKQAELNSKISILEKKKIELEQQQRDLKAEITISRSREQVMDEFLSDISSNEEEDVVHMATTRRRTDGHQKQSHVLHDNFPQQTTVHMQPEPPLKENGEDIKESLLKTLVAMNNLTRLPAPEPGVFKGDPLDYPGWNNAFETLVVSRGIPKPERLHYLKRYLEGEAREAVKGYFQIISDASYDNAMNRLEKYYGNTFTIAESFRNKLEQWPKLPTRDGMAIRRLTDFLQQCHIAMETVPGLKILNDEHENRKLLTKLPGWLVSSWARKITSYKAEHHTFPPFEVFLRYLENEAEVACEPVTRFVENSNERVNQRGQRRDPPVRTLNTQTKKPVHTQNNGKSSINSPMPRKYHVPEACYLCKSSSHSLDSCYEFNKLALDQRLAYVKETNLCFGCLCPGHRSRRCQQRLTCKVCNNRHPTSLHGPPKISQGQVEAESRACAAISKDEIGTTTKSSMIVPVWISHKERPETEQLVYALLDTQSDTTFLLESLADSLKLKGEDVCLKLSTMSSSSEIVKTKRYTGLTIRAYNSVKKIDLPPSYHREEIPVKESHIPTPDGARRWSYLKKIVDELMPLHSCPAGILIGYNCTRALAPREVIVSPDEEGPFAVRTDLGWSIIGGCGDSDTSISHRLITYEVPSDLVGGTAPMVTLALRNSCKEVIDPSDIKRMMEIEFSETTDSTMSQEDITFIEQMEQGVRRRSDGRYEVPIPLKRPDCILPDNRTQAEQRLEQLRRRLKRNRDLRECYIDQMSKLLTDGHAEIASDYEDGKSWYVPHHGVYNADKRKLRIVFDCSARFKGTALNDHLLSGPDMTNSLVGVLLRFRKEDVAVTCDIQGMFHQFCIPETQRNWFRFLWWKNGNLEDEIVEYRMTVHLFGATSSPGCANHGFRKLASDNEAEYGAQATNFIKRHFYVDDGLISLKSKEEAIHLMKKTIDMCKTSGLKLHKFQSNEQAVLETLGESSSETSTYKDLSIDQQIQRALGVHWCIVDDTFTFQITLRDSPLTKRGIMSTISSIYDPLGLVAPVLLLGRQILQKICKEGGDWDDPVEEGIHMVWQSWRTNLFKLDSLQIPRCYKPKKFGMVKTIELHHFSDASEGGYGQCTYLRMISTSNKVHCALVIGKSRVSPSKVTTIPRLELATAVLSARVSAFVNKELDYGQMKEFFWTDSRVVLGYISNEAKRFHVFVANRVQEVRNLTDPNQWRHIAGSSNPADEASRGVTVEEFLVKSNWLTGPDFLWDLTLPEQDTVLRIEDSGDPEVRQVKNTTTNVVFSERLRYSSWSKVIRVVAICLKFMKSLKEKKRRVEALEGDCREEDNGSGRVKRLRFNVEELRDAENTVIRLCQKEQYVEEIERLQENARTESTTERWKGLPRGSSLYKLNPVIDRNRILRVGGRLSESPFPEELKFPVIIPRKHWIAELIARHCHEKIYHQGRGMTVNEIRRMGFWIVGCSSTVYKEISRCVHCRRYRGRPQEQKMADLPQDRVSEAPPFTYSAVDMFGPFFTKDGRKERKRYGALFTCMMCRAIHIEVADSMTTDSFISSLRRFIAIRGQVRQLRSDQGSNFVGTKNELARCLEEMDQDAVFQFLSANQCDYVINSPAASHQGGVWERQIRTVRSVISSTLEQASSQLTDDALRTLLYEAMAIVNSRPLTTENLYDNSLEPLTPNHILTMKSSIVLPPPGRFVKEDVYLRKQWRRVQHFTNEFWHRWKKEYLHNLQPRQKWNKTRRDLKIKDIVIIKDDDVPRGQWKLGRITDVFNGVDGHVRRVKMQVADKKLNNRGKRERQVSYLERPVQKLVLLLETDD